MDINSIRIAVTVVSFVAFLGIFVWAYGRGAKRDFDEAALLPFTEDDNLDAGRGRK
jgi:cytochrome c oxidase cbb3-type subunit IV